MNLGPSLCPSKVLDLLDDISFKSVLNNYNLTFLLIPHFQYFNDTDYYYDFKLFLKSNKINFIDAAQGFKNANLSHQELYWYHDGHINNKGNELLGRYLHEKLS